MSGALDGIRVIELGQLLAGPFAGTLLSYFGAEVIKVEPPGGDPIRGWREVQNGTSLWWHSLARNKKCVSLDLKTDAGRNVVRQLIAKSDVLIENFRPGVLEEWELSPSTLRKDNPHLIVARISGYGQTGPYANKPGYASVCEGFGGFRYLNGMPGEAPVRPNLSTGDTVAGLHAALGICMSLLASKNSNDVAGQEIDVALYESMFNLLEAVVPEYSGANVVREPSGTTVTGIVPTNTYRSRDGKFLIIGGNGDSIFKRLMKAAGRSDLADDPRMENNVGRVAHEQEIDEALAKWCASLNCDDLLHQLEHARVPAGPIYSVADMFKDPHYRDRGMFEQVEINGKALEIPAILPKLSKTPGETLWPGPMENSHREEVLSDILGLSAEEIARL